MIFEITTVKGDTSGNQWTEGDVYYVDMPSLEDAIAEFPTNTAFVKFGVKEIKISDPNEVKQLIKDKQHGRRR